MLLLKNLVPVKSSYLHSAGYDAAGKRLAIRFRNGLVRFYAEPVQTFQALMAASSPGRFFNAHIKHVKRKKTSRPLIESQKPEFRCGRKKVINAA